MIYFKSLSIKGYKGFVDSGEIPLNVPNGDLGSGLNIFVGENGSGKTAILKAISLLSASSFVAQNRISCSDFNNAVSTDSPIEVVGILDKTIKYAMPSPWKYKFDLKEFHFTIKHRDNKTPGKLLSSQFSSLNIVEPTSRTIPATKNREAFDVTDFYLTLDQERLEDEALNIFYYDLERTRQIKTGFSTTFGRVMDDMNWKYLKDAVVVDIKKKWNECRSVFIKQELGQSINTLLAEKFNRPDLAKIQLEPLNIEEPYSSAFLAISTEEKLTQIPISELGSGVELIFAILFLKQIASQSKGTIVYCIDEPELSLHPQWQKILFEILKEEAKSKQIFISTHSPYFFDASMIGNVKKVVSDGVSGSSVSKFSPTVLNDEKALSLFNLENRELLFSRKVLIVEGWEDRERLRKFLQSTNNDIFVMVGLQNLQRVENICKDLALPFKAVVDLDYLRNDPELLPDISDIEIESLKEVNALDEIISTTKNEIIKKEANKIKDKIKQNDLCLLSSKIKSKVSTSSDYAIKVSAKIEALKNDGIYVLPNGVIEDYLDDLGAPKSEELKAELLEIIKM